MIDHYPNELKQLIHHLKKLPGVGARSAERFAFGMLGWKDPELKQLAALLGNFKESITYCPNCHCIQENKECSYCFKNNRDSSILCIVSHAKDTYAIEKTGTFKGIYHVLGGLLSPIEGTTPESLKMDSLLKRIEQESVQEVIMALDSTLEGDATSLYLKKLLSEKQIPITRLAYGIPIGSPLEFVDGTTLSRAFSGRQKA